MVVVHPLGIEAIPAALGRVEQTRVVQVAFGRHDRRPTPAFAGRSRGLFDGPQEMMGTQVEDHIGGIQAQAVEMKLLEPHPDVVKHEVANRVAARTVIIDGGAPGRLVTVGKVRPELAEVIRFGTEVVVNDVEEDGQSMAMASVDQPLQPVRTAVSVLRRVREHAVVAPVP